MPPPPELDKVPPGGYSAYHAFDTLDTVSAIHRIWCIPAPDTVHIVAPTHRTQWHR